MLLSSRLKPRVPTRPNHHINITVHVLLCGEANVLFQRIHAHIPRDKWSPSVQQRWRGSWLWRSHWPSISGPSIYCLSHWYAQASGFILLGLCYSKELNLNGKKWALTKAGGFNLLQWFPKGGQAAAATHIPSHKAKQSCRAAAGVYVTGHSL